MRRPNPMLVVIAMLAFGLPTRPSSFEPVATPEVHLRWTRQTIQVALSTSLLLPSQSIVEGSDVDGAVSRALNSWTNASGIKFVLVSTNAQSVSPISQGDGINLITIASTAENMAMFNGEGNAARTRVFYDSVTGAISEADIVLNPMPYSSAGIPAQFSTDGTPGTYDLESTLTHEIGHLLGLNHSNDIGATMQPSQALNGIFEMPAWTERSLSHVDTVAVRNLYGPCQDLGTVRGRILNNTQGSLLAAAGVHVWLEDIASGRLIADVVTGSSGNFKVRCVPAGEYRVVAEYVDDTSFRDRVARQKSFRSTEISNNLRVTANKTTAVNYVFVPPNNSPRTLVPRYLGLNADLSIVPIPARAGEKLTVFISGPGVDQVPGSGFVVNSPFISVDAASLSLRERNPTMPVVSFEITIAANAPAGEYTIRLQSNSGETAYLAGAITIDPRN